jgi:hypothetical protein
MDDYTSYWDLAQKYGTGMAIILIPTVWELWKLHKSHLKDAEKKAVDNATILNNLTQSVIRLPGDWKDAHGQLIQKLDERFDQLRDEIRK